ncbi:MAG: FMN-binding protein [Bacillota bacterium]
MKPKKKGVGRVLKRIGVSALALILLMVLYGMLGLKQTLALSIGAVNLSEIPDGDYTGTYDCYRWSSEVEVSVRGHAITGIEVIKGQNGREDIQNELIVRVLQAQSPAVDAVSGATADSKAILKAVESALENAQQ